MRLAGKTLCAAMVASVGTAVAVAPAGAVSLKTVSKSTRVSGLGTAKSVTATCPVGMKAVGGGFNQSVPDLSAPSISALIIYESRRITQRSWRVGGTQNGNGGSNLSAIAYCERRGRVAQRSKSSTLPASNGAVAKATATCPAGKRAISGGFRTAPADFSPLSVPVIFENMRPTRRSWRVGAIRSSFGAGGGSDPVTSYVYCAGPRPLFRSGTLEFTGNQGDLRTTASPLCPRDRSAAAGGFRTPLTRGPGDKQALAQIYRSIRSGRRWSIGAVYTGNQNLKVSMTSFAYCR